MKEIRNVFLIQLFKSFTSSILFILVPLLMAERNIDITTIGLVFAAGPFIFQLSRMGFASISDVIGRKIFLISNGMLTSITSVIYYFAYRPFEFLYGYIVSSVKDGAFWSVNRAYVLDVSKEARKDLVVMKTIDYVVSGIGYLITGYLIVWLLYSGTILIVFVLGLFGALVAFGIKSDKKNRIAIKKALSNLDFRKRSKLFKKFIILFIIAGFAYGFIDGYVMPLFLKSSGFSVEAIGLLIGLQTIISGIFIYVYTRKGNMSKILLYGGIFYAITLSILGFVNVFWIAIVFLLFGIGVGVTDGCYEGIYVKISNKKSYASDISLLLFGLHVGRSINQAVAGFLIQSFGFGIVFILSSAIFLIYSTWASKILR